jgi:CRISPR associated protein Cas1
MDAEGEATEEVGRLNFAASAAAPAPSLGLVHTDQRNRDSLACDLMEPVRPRVDAYVLDLLASHEFRKDDFFEMGDGHCRLLPPLTAELIQTGSPWARLVLRVAQLVAAKLSLQGTDRSTHFRTRRTHWGVTRQHRPLTAIQEGKVEDPRRAPGAGAKRPALCCGLSERIGDGPAIMGLPMSPSTDGMSYPRSSCFL